MISSCRLRPRTGAKNHNRSLTERKNVVFTAAI
jgi:hypothetical protein